MGKTPIGLEWGAVLYCDRQSGGFVNRAVNPFNFMHFLGGGGNLAK